MKSEHRHQLKTNELAEWIANFPQWVKKNATMIIYVSVFAVLVGGAYIWKVYEKDVVAVREQLEFTGAASRLSSDRTRILRAQAQGIDIAYSLLQTADNLQKVAEDAEDDEMAAFALIKQAESLRTELHYRFGIVNKESMTEQINRAKESYTKAVEKSSDNPSLSAMAKFGLGLCEEELGNYEQARDIYDEIVANPDFQYTVILPQAQLRLQMIDAYSQQVVFQPALELQAPVEAAEPEIDIRIPQLPEVDLPGP